MFALHCASISLNLGSSGSEVGPLYSAGDSGREVCCCFCSGPRASVGGGDGNDDGTSEPAYCDIFGFADSVTFSLGRSCGGAEALGAIKIFGDI
jgi:hypothetical protein